jgi:hypothetical protein
MLLVIRVRVTGCISRLYVSLSVCFNLQWLLLQYNRGHAVKGQWVFGGVERESGKTFFVPFPDTTADTVMAVTSDWIEPGTTIISDCWAAYRDLHTHGYTQHTVNHTIGFVDELIRIPSRARGVV